MHHGSRTHHTLTVAALLLASLCIPAQWALALGVNSSGAVTDWNVTPFPTGFDVGAIHNGWAPALPAMPTIWLEQNNYSPVSYPSGIGNLPSPGGSNGEMVDLEAMYARVNTSLATPSLQVLLVTSMAEHIWYQPWGRHYRLGDLFLDVNGDQTYDYGVATTNWDAAQAWQSYDPATKKFETFDHAPAPGTVYGIEYSPGDPIGHGDEVVTVVGLNTGGYGDNAYVEGQVRPWVINQDVATPVQSGGQYAVAGLNAMSFEYSAVQGGSILGGGFYSDDEFFGTGSARNEDGTWLYEWTIPLSWIDPAGHLTAGTLDMLGLHITVECGNDTLDIVGTPPPDVPEPLTMLGMAMGIGHLARYLRKRRSL